MNSSLLNIWRENGAYLRYGDAKNGALCAVSLGILGSMIRHTTISSDVSWNLLQYVELLWEFGFGFCLCVILSLVATMATAFSIVPTLSKRAIRINVVLKLSNFLNLMGSKSDQGTVYFLDIANFSSGEAYLNSVAAKAGIEQDDVVKNKDLAEQIWIVSRIGASKHCTFLISLLLVIAAGVLYPFV